MIGWRGSVYSALVCSSERGETTFTFSRRASEGFRLLGYNVSLFHPASLRRQGAPGRQDDGCSLNFPLRAPFFPVTVHFNRLLFDCRGEGENTFARNHRDAIPRIFRLTAKDAKKIISQAKQTLRRRGICRRAIFRDIFPDRARASR